MLNRRDSLDESDQIAKYWVFLQNIVLKQQTKQLPVAEREFLDKLTIYFTFAH
jgi:hypothetical protein